LAVAAGEPFDVSSTQDPNTGVTTMFLSLLIPALPPDGPAAAPHTAMVQPAPSSIPLDLVLCDCRDAESPDTPEGRPLGADISPAWSYVLYARDTGGREIDISQTKVSILAMPKHGKFEGNWQSKTGGPTFAYMPEPGFRGKDEASFLLEVDGQRVKVVYTLHTVEMLTDDPIHCTGNWPRRIAALGGNVPALGLSAGLDSSAPAAGVLPPAFVDLPDGVAGHQSADNSTSSVAESSVTPATTAKAPVQATLDVCLGAENSTTHDSIPAGLNPGLAVASVVLHSVWNLSGCWRGSLFAGCRERSWSR
jgi:hypothetical protein